MSGTRGFKVVDDPVAQQAPPQTQIPAGHALAMKAAAEGVGLALRALSARATASLSGLFTMILVGASWWLWSTVLPTPTPLQLISLGMWAVFVLAIEIVRRRN